jgi:hypothetical protein
MKKNMYIYYDEMSDYFVINTNKKIKGEYRDINEGVSEIVDKKTGRTTGFAVLGFRKFLSKSQNIALLSKNRALN